MSPPQPFAFPAITFLSACPHAIISARNLLYFVGLVGGESFIG